MTTLALASIAETPVAVFDNCYAPTLAFLSSLGSRGIPVHVYGSGRGGAARWSRYCSRYSPCPPLDQADLFLPWLRARLRSGEIARVAPTTDQLAFYLSELRDEFPPEVRRAIPTLVEIENCLIKPRFAAACARISQAVPETGEAVDEKQAEALAAKIGFPLMLKPKSHLAIGMRERGHLVSTPAQLCKWFQPYSIPVSQNFIADRYPELRRPMLQRFVPSARQRVYSVSGIRDADRGIVAASLSCKTEQWPPDVGVSTRQVSWTDERVLNVGIAVVDRLLSCGIFELELLAEGEQLLAIDLNPRAFGFIALNMALGHDLPWLWFQSTFGPVEPLAEGPRPAVLECRFTLPYHVSRWIALLKGPRRWHLFLQYGRDLIRRSIPMEGRWRDPLPMLMAQCSILRHPGGLVRPFLRRKVDSVAI